METSTLPKHVPADVRSGLPYSELQRLISLLDLSQHEVASLLLVSERTLARRRREGRFTQAESDRVVRLNQLFNQAAEVFDGRIPAAVEWLTTPKTLLGGETPLQHADTEPGLAAVRDMLSVIQYNVAA